MLKSRWSCWLVSRLSSLVCTVYTVYTVIHSNNNKTILVIRNKSYYVLLLSDPQTSGAMKDLHLRLHLNIELAPSQVTGLCYLVCVLCGTCSVSFKYGVVPTDRELNFENWRTQWVSYQMWCYTEPQNETRVHRRLYRIYWNLRGRPHTHTVYVTRDN